MRLPLCAVAAVMVLSACTSSYRVVQVPQYGADLYPQSQTRAGVTVAVDEIRSHERAERLFGADLIKAGILPVNVVVSNFGKQRILLRPADVLLHQGREILDPVPPEVVMGFAKGQKSLNKSTKEEVDKFFEETLFKETALSPGQSYRGVIFFSVPPGKPPVERFFRSWNVYRDGGAKIRVGVTHVDSGERVVFAPFPIAMPENAGKLSY